MVNNLFMCFLCRDICIVKEDIWKSNAFSRRNNTVTGAVFIEEGPFSQPPACTGGLEFVIFRFIQSKLHQQSGSQWFGCPSMHCTCFILLPVYDSVNQIHTYLASNSNRNRTINTFMYIVSFNPQNYYVQ